MRKLSSFLLSIVLILGFFQFRGATVFADSSSDFTIENGVLTRYSGKGGNVTIPNCVTSIGYEAFKDCISVTSITIPNSVTSIENDAFWNCTSLTNVAIPNSVKNLGWVTFSNCTSLKSVIIPNSVTSIGFETFFGCTSLTSVVIPNSVISIDNSAFVDCTSLTSVDIPNSVTSIGGSSFWGCTNLKSVIIPNSVSSVGDIAFYGCTSLTSAVIPNSVTSIADRAFMNCKNATILGQSNSYAKEYADKKNIPFKSLINWETYKEIKLINTLNKDFTVKFNKALNPSSVNSENIYVATDEYGQNKINNVSVKLSDTGKEILVNYENKSLWESGKTYYLFVTINIQSEDGKNLNDPIRMQFNIK